jgi:hypothetical protein
MIFMGFDFSKTKMPLSVTKNVVTDDFMLNQAVEQLKKNLSII